MLKIPFFRLGSWKHPVYGDLRITQQTFDQMLANFHSGVLGREPFIRVGHDAAGKNVFGDAEALGWVREIRQEGDVLAAVVEPVSEAVAMLIREKRYRFASAEFTANGTDKETGQNVGALLSAIALTNEPFLTRLPEATLLADGGELFYMDYDEIKGGTGMEEMLKKLAETIKGFISSNQAQQSALKAAVEAQQQEAQKQLAEMKTLMENQVKLAEEKAKLESQARVLAEVEKTAAALVAEGIPPVMVAQWKQLAISEQGQTTIKLADAKGQLQDTTQADAIKAMLLALPKEHRVAMEQRGTQSEPDDKVKLACDADIVALGGEVTADGKYKI